jgi:FKBP-type peptidyl-prolyl cis-trans isomerase FklB
MQHNYQPLHPALTTSAFTLLLVTPLLALGAAGTSSELKTPRQVQSYALGMNVGRQVKARTMDVDPDLVVRGLRDSLSNDSTLLTADEAGSVVRDLRLDMKRQEVAHRREAVQRNKEEGEAFLAANKNKKGIVTLPSGLQYKIIKPGTGSKPTPGDTVICNYRGTLLDGTEFDSSYRRKRPTAFSLKRVMKGWKQAIPLMSVGSKWQLFVPPELAFGRAGASNAVGPDATLIFELELLGIRGGAAGRQEPQTETAGRDTGIVEQKAGIGVQAAARSTAPLADMRISFKLDPRVSGATYGGERWIAAPTFTSPRQVGKEASIEARAEGVTRNGAPVSAAAEWKPADPEMVTVAQGEGDHVKLTVHYPGQSRVTVAANGVSKELLVKATYVGDATQVEISR